MVSSAMIGGCDGCSTGTAGCGGGARRRGARDLGAVGAAAKVVAGFGAAVPDRAGRRRLSDEQGHRRGAGLPSRDGVEVAQAVRRAAPGRAERRPAAGAAAQDHRRGDRGRAGAHLGDRPGGRDALVDAFDGQSGRGDPDRGEPDMARVRAQAPSRRRVQGVPRPAVRRQGPRRRGPVPEPPRGSGGAVRGRKDPDPGARPPRRSCR